ncbi:MAG TPA: alpha/beta hydrolase fold domain-containing protein [Acidocella sp.]|jgi:acetyl esterase/lipase|nr:alpha/beta hydrolase fold domain-containing protein [Acidocella sp.]
MPSWQSYVINPLLRLTVKRRLARITTPIAARAVLGNTPPPPPAGATFTPGALGGVEGEWVQAEDNSAGLLLYLHGGGYFSCSPVTHRAITAAFALRGFTVFAPRYRLAPEHPFPAALDDALAAYQALLTQAPGRFVIGGDSAGGGLALALLLAIKARNLPMPACATLFCPWTDLAATGGSLTRNAGRESLLYGPKIKDAAALYLQGQDPTNPLASPLYGDFTGLPPLLIQVGATEILLDDSTRVAARAEAAGVSVELSIWDNLPHVWHVAQYFLPEARIALDQAASFAKSALASGTARA